MGNVGALILAAGGSTRFGEPKQFLQFKGETLLRRIAKAAHDAGCAPIVVVAGDSADRVNAELQDLPVYVVQNAQWRCGIGTSIKCGVAHLRNAISAIVILACDQPFVDADLIRHLIALREKTGKEIVASSYSDTVGVPALFTRFLFPELMALNGDSGAKNIIFANRGRVAEFPFAEGKIDIDTRADYENLTTESHDASTEKSTRERLPL